jgi:cytochrome c556
MRKLIPLVVALATIVAAPPLLSQEAATPAASGGPELADNPADLVAARRALMAALGEQFGDLTFAAEGATDAELYSLQVQARSVAAMLRAFPHLFQATTAPTDEAFLASGVDTDAADAVWTDFATFYQIAQQSAEAATAMAAATTPAELLTLSADVQATCDSCHATFLAYEPFDFGAAPAEAPAP